MNKLIHHNQVNRILLKPRFKMQVSQSQNKVLRHLEAKLSLKNNEFDYKIVTHHIVLDIKKEANHFWSPQLHLEIERQTDSSSVIKGLFGPKPQVWTFFMFLHFAVAISFIVFLVIAYSNYILNKDYSFALTVCIVLPIIWVIFYIFGQLGKRKGYKQMQELHNFLMVTLSKYKLE